MTTKTEAKAEAEAKTKAKSKLIAFAAITCAFALCLTLVGCGSNEAKKAFVGTWELTEMSNASADDIALIKSLGLTVEATFAEDGTFTMDMFGENVIEGTWKASDTTKVTISADSEGTSSTIEATLADNKLTIAVNEESMTLEKTSEETQDSSATS